MPEAHKGLRRKSTINQEFGIGETWVRDQIALQKLRLMNRRNGSRTTEFHVRSRSVNPLIATAIATGKISRWESDPSRCRLSTLSRQQSGCAGTSGSCRERPFAQQHGIAIRLFVCDRKPCEHHGRKPILRINPDIPQVGGGQSCVAKECMLNDDGLRSFANFCPPRWRPCRQPVFSDPRTF